MRLRASVLAIALLFGCGGAMAQNVQPSNDVLVINAERLFAESQIGNLIREETQARRLELQAENERIIEELISEEQDLASRRSEMEPEDFRIAADAFDQKAVEIRAARDAKEQRINRAAEEAQTRFNDQVREVAGQVMIELGGTVILDSRSVYLALRSVDITDAVIERLDALAAEAGNAATNSDQVDAEPQAIEPLGLESQDGAETGLTTGSE